MQRSVTRETLIKRTNKAELWRLDDNLVVKRYFVENSVERVLHDQRSLLYIEEAFGEVDYQGWSYRSVKLLCLGIDRKSVGLEFVSGNVLVDVPKARMKEAEYHCGVLLAQYHNKVLGASNEGLIYTDFCVQNIVIDFPGQSITVIDPGMAWGRLGNVHEDLVQHINSVIMVLVSRRKASLSDIMGFLKGYRGARRAQPHLRVYLQGLARQLRRQFLTYAGESSWKCLAFSLAVCILSPFYLVVVPAKLSGRGK